jgi:ribosomal protein S18 acetylase RimI-like enzyme
MMMMRGTGLAAGRGRRYARRRRLRRRTILIWPCRSSDLCQPCQAGHSCQPDQPGRHDQPPDSSAGLPPMRAAQSLDDSLRPAATVAVSLGMAASSRRPGGGAMQRRVAGDARPRVHGPAVLGGAPGESRIYRFSALQGEREAGEVRVRFARPAAIFIHDLNVARPYRGRGLGVRLVDAALRFGARNHCTRARLEADDNGSGRLLRWYRGLGFRPAGMGTRGSPAMEADIGRALALTSTATGRRRGASSSS